MWMIFMKDKNSGKVYPCNAKWPKRMAQEICDALNASPNKAVEYYTVEEGGKDDPYTCNAGEETPRTSRDTKTPQTDRTG